MNLQGENIWVTGASSGIGKELALRLSSSANKVFVSARRRDDLLSVCSVNQNLIPVPCDVADRSSVKEAVENISRHTRTLDRLIINAGICEYFDFNCPDWQMAERVMSTNYLGSVNTLEAALPLLQRLISHKDMQGTNKKPHIIVIASLATLIPFPRAEVYGASKAAIDYFFQSASLDLANQGIDVTVVSPGFVKTPLTNKNDFSMPFIVSVDTAVDEILKVLERRPKSYSFPNSLFFLLRFFKCAHPLWRWLAINKLSRVTRETVDE